MDILGRGRHPRGSADPVGSIWRQYRAKRRHGDLFQTIFDKIQPETVKSGPRLPSVESGPRLSSVESGPRLPSEKSGQVAAARVAAAGALAPAGALATPAIARARLCRARAIPAFTPYAPAGAKAPAAATIAAAATWPDFSDGNLGPDATDDNLGPDSTGVNGVGILKMADFPIWVFVTSTPWGQVEDGGLSFGNFYITRSWEED